MILPPSYSRTQRLLDLSYQSKAPGSSQFGSKSSSSWIKFTGSYKTKCFLGGCHQNFKVFYYPIFCCRWLARQYHPFLHYCSLEVWNSVPIRPQIDVVIDLKVEPWLEIRLWSFSCFLLCKNFKDFAYISRLCVFTTKLSLPLALFPSSMTAMHFNLGHLDQCFKKFNMHTNHLGMFQN